MPTPTPWPTLPPEVVQEQVRSLLEDNGGCRLPCLWGIVPGATTGKEAYALLAPLASDVAGSVEDEDGSFGVFITELPPGLEGLVRIAVHLRGGSVERMQPVGFEDVAWLDMPRLLREYGPPSEVWMSTNSQFHGGPPVTVFLLYSDLGILAQYSEYGHFDGEFVRACLDDTPTLRLWRPEYPLDFQEAKDLFMLGSDPSILDLPSEEAMGLTAEAFFNAYSAVDRPCFSTPRALWPTISGRPYVPGG